MYNNFKNILKNNKYSIDALCYVNSKLSHRTGVHPSGDIIIFSVARSGSTWVEEIVASQRNIKLVNEPLIMNRLTKNQLGVQPCWDITLPNVIRNNIYRDYFKRIISGNCGFGSPSIKNKFFRKNYDRLVIKILRSQDMINWFETEFNVKIIYLIRHPIGVALSRKECDRLPLFLKNEIFRQKYLNHDMISLSEKIIQNGTIFEKLVVDWCIQNLVPLNYLDNSKWCILFYEDLIIKPHDEILKLCTYLNLENMDAATQRLYISSGSTHKSDAKTQNILNSDISNDLKQNYLITKWKNKVTELDLDFTQNALDTFGIKCYNSKSFLPVKN